VSTLVVPQLSVKEPLSVALAVTAASGLSAHLLPERFVATAIGFVFLGATYVFAWRNDDATVEHYGVALGGLVVPHAGWTRTLRDGTRALLWAALLGALVTVPFVIGFRFYWGIRGALGVGSRFDWSTLTGRAQGLDFLSRAAGQILMIALPEEAFYRGYLQTRLDDALPRRLRVFGAPLGWSLLLTSAIFAVGHIVTIPSPQRLAVFFPSLLFGWLRARTRGIGASIAFHAFCNLLSASVGQGFGVYR
jgi:uncharacterized protein